MDTETKLLAEVEEAAAALEMALAKLRVWRLSHAADRPKEDRDPFHVIRVDD